MNIITKILAIIIYISILSTVHCKAKELSLKETNIPDKIFGIDFCKLQLKDILIKLRSRKIITRCYDTSYEHEVGCTDKKEDLSKTTLIDTNYFIGTLLKNNDIIKVYYFYEPDDMYFIVSIKAKKESYETILDQLNKQLGHENANINRRNFDEISWDAYTVSDTCIMGITLSKRQQYDDPAKAEKGVCYLEIRTRARSLHVH